MSSLRQILSCLAAVAVTVSANAQSEPPIRARTALGATNLIPPMPVVESPVTFFRQLLMMPVSERNKSLAGRSPEARARIAAKIFEYQKLDPNERELRLRATELRWYLTPLLRTPPADRQEALALIPEDLRGLAKSRLDQWDLLPPALQREFLANDKTLHYFAQPAAVATNTQSQQIADEFGKFFDLTEREKQKMLGTLSEAERFQMEKTLKTFDELPPQQRNRCIHNYAKFAGMSNAERAEFLKSAESWSKMSPQERQSWRDLVAHVPIWPPNPPPTLPPLPNAPVRAPRAHMATN